MRSEMRNSERIEPVFHISYILNQISNVKYRFVLQPIPFRFCILIASAKMIA